MSSPTSQPVPTSHSYPPLPAEPSTPLSRNRRGAGSQENDTDEWVGSFKIPTSFSKRTMDCLKTGILTQSSRTEIIQALANHMWIHTQHPSRYAYTHICSELVKVHPKLADDAGDDQVTYASLYFNTDVLIDCRYKIVFL